MKLAALQQAIRAVEPAAVLVSSRTLDRLIQQIGNVQSLLGEVPHRESLVLDRHVLFRYAEQEELGLESDQLLPTPVLLLARPTADELESVAPDLLLRNYWQRLFHASVHATFKALQQEGKLTQEQVRARIDQLGEAEFAEARRVLEEDNHLLPDADELAVFIEFVATFLELKYFAPEALAVWFPALQGRDELAQHLAEEVGATPLFERLRPAGAVEPGRHPTDRKDEAHEYYWKLVAAADEAARVENRVRAAVLRRRAARVAPTTLAANTRAAAVGELEKLAVRLQTALQLSDADLAEWRKDLPILLDKTDQGKRPPEIALLFDLQQLCIDHERTLYTLDVVEWVLSAGKRPIKRPLPGQRLVRITGHLRRAAQRLTMSRLSEGDRRHLGSLLETALLQSEARLRERFHPLLVDALQNAGLQPANLPEQVAFDKMAEELLDRVRDHGYFTFSELRDTLSRNQLKLPDLTDPQDFIRGDPLLRLDRRLATVLDGIYRPSEFYMRWLERFSALNFGTPAGRWLTQHVTVPFGGSLLMVKLAELGLHHLGVQGYGDLATPLTGWLSYAAWLLLGGFLLALLHSAKLRRRCVQVGRAVGEALHRVFIEVPMRLANLPALQRFTSSWPFQLFFRFVFTPLLVCGALALSFPELFIHVLGGLGVFLAAVILFNSRPWRGTEEILSSGIVSLYRLLRAGLIPSLLAFVVQFFKELLEGIEYVQFRVDEWLRFRGGEGQPAIIARAVLGLLWFPVSYLTRFYVVVLVEPMLNPIKLPISSIASKFVYPTTLAFTPVLIASLAPFLGSIPAYVFGSVTMFLLPDAFGFLVWEAKENWSLYRANRPAGLRPVPIGRHGETVGRLLHPGFHSGIVPKLFARLRHAERHAAATGSRQAVRQCQDDLRNVATAVRRFAERELLALLHRDAVWQGQPLSVARVILATNRIAVEVAHAQYGDAPLRLEFESREGWLLAGIGQTGWLSQLAADQRSALATALTGYYKLAGVHFVREQLHANQPAAIASFSVTDVGLVLWLKGRTPRGVVCDPRDPEGRFRPHGEDIIPAEWPAADARQLVFSQIPVTWAQWLASWDHARNGRLSHRNAEGLAALVLPTVPPNPR